MDGIKKFFRINLLVINFLMTLSAFTQTGPGGVGKTDGTSGLRIWLQGDKGVVTNGNEVTNWNDQSGWNNVATADAGQRPELITNSLNGLPGLQFSSDKMSIVANASIQTVNNNIFVVVRRNSASTFGTILARRFWNEGHAWETPYTSFSIQANKNSSGTPYVQATINGPVFLSNYESPHNEIANSQPYLHQFVYDGSRLESWINNANPKIANGTGQLNFNSNSNPFMLGYGGGTSDDYPNDYLDGLIYELIYFGENVNVCRQVVILNYLASKYGLTVAYDKYAEVAGFTNDVAGIGSEGSDTHIESSGGGITLFANSGYPADTWNSYIFSGHNNGEMKGTPLNVPSGNNNRLQRVWNIQKTGTSPTNLTIKFTLPQNPGADKTKYGLLWSANADFSNPVEITLANSVNVGNRTVSFYFSDLSVLPNGFYTLGNKLNHWNGSTGPLWATSSNWDGNTPDENAEVLIAGECSNYPVMAENIQIKSLSIETGGFLSAWTYNLTMSGLCNISGGFNAGSGKVIIIGDQNSSVYCGEQSFKNLEIVKSSGKNVAFMDNYFVAGNLVLSSGTIETNYAGELGGNLMVSAGETIWGRNLTLNGSSTQTISLASNALVSLSDLIVNNTSSSQIVDASQVATTGELRTSTITLNDGHLKWGHDLINQLVIEAGTVFELSQDVNAGKSWTNNGGQFLPDSFKVSFTLGGSYNLRTSNQPFDDLTINKSGGTLTLLDNLQVNGDFNLQTGTFNAGNNFMSVSGNMNLTGTFNCGTSSLFFDGTNQEITGNSTVFYNLETESPAMLEFNGTSGNTWQVSEELTIGSGSSVVVGTDQNLTIEGTVTNNSGMDGLIIKSDETSTGTLIHNTTGINATIERYIGATEWSDPEDGWHFLASPVDGFLLEGSGFITSPANSYDFFAWSESQNLWLNQKLPENNITFFNKGQGYLISYDNEDIKEFTGNLEVSDVEVTGLTKSGENRGWHLLGNPFAAPIEWNDGNWLLQNIAGVAKIWDEAGKSYVDISANEIIPQMQGFMVQAMDVPGSLVIPASARVGSQVAWYKSDGTEKIVLTASEADGRSSQKCSIIINPEATIGFDAGFDCHFLPGYAPQFYSLSGNEKLSTSSIPEVAVGQAVQLVFIKNQASEYRINLAETIENQVLFLTDKKTGIVQNLNENPQYNFTSQAEDLPGRFLLNFETLGTTEPEKPLSGFAFCDGTQILVQTDEMDSQLKIYNIKGQLVFSQKFTSPGLHSPDFKPKTGVFLLVLENAKRISTSKIFLL